MQPRAFGDIYCFPVPVAIGTDENLLQAKLAWNIAVVFKILQQFNKHFWNQYLKNVFHCVEFSK